MKISDIESWRAGIELQELASDITSLMARCKQAEEMVSQLQRKLELELEESKDLREHLRELEKSQPMSWGVYKARVCAFESTDDGISVRLKIKVDKELNHVFHTGAEFTVRLEENE